MPRLTGSELTHGAPLAGLAALTASIAHEVNQPLAGIMVNASICLRMLASDPPDVDGALETARRTMRDANRATDVIARLRALFSKQRSASDPLDLNEAAHEVIERSSDEWRRSGVTVREELAPGLPPVAGDRVQLQQVIFNLLTNAVEAMKGIGHGERCVVVRTQAEKRGGVRVSVQDAGVGIEPADLRRIFEAFYTTKAGGMGIGLFVCNSIVVSHGGRLWATPNAGAGVTVSFWIPGPRTFS